MCFYRLLQCVGVKNFDQLAFHHVQDVNGYLKRYERVIISVHATTLRPKNNFGVPQKLQKVFDGLNNDQEVIVVFFGNPLILNNIYDFTNVDAILLAYSSS